MKFGIKEYKYYIEKYKTLCFIYPFEYYNKKIEEFIGKYPEKIDLDFYNVWKEVFDIYHILQQLKVHFIPEIIFPSLVCFIASISLGEITEVQ